MTLQHAPRKGSFFSLHFLLFRFRRRRRSLPWLLLLLLLPLLLLPLLLLSLEDEDDESESDDDDDDDDEEEDEDEAFALLSLSFSCSFFKCSRMRSVNPPNPMLVKKLMENIQKKSVQSLCLFFFKNILFCIFAVKRHTF